MIRALLWVTMSCVNAVAGIETGYSQLCQQFPL